LNLRPHYNSVVPEVDFGGLATFNLASVFGDDVPDSLTNRGLFAFVRAAGLNDTKQIGRQAAVA
jgi:hypothetical protein